MKVLGSEKLIEQAQFIGELYTIYKLLTFKTSIYSIWNTILGAIVYFLKD
mgnify:CR=1 FL=1